MTKLKLPLLLTIAFTLGVFTHKLLGPEIIPTKATPQSQTNTELNTDSKDVLSSEPVTIDIVKNNELEIAKEEIKQLSSLNESLANSVSSLEEELSSYQSKKNNKRQVSKILSSREYNKSVSMYELEQAFNEVKTRLGLDLNQSEALKALLKQKAEVEIDFRMALYLDSNVHHSKDWKDKLSLAQQDFEYELSALLSDKQLDNYLTFEKEKALARHNRTMNYRKAHMLTNFEDLNDYQKQQITTYYDNLEPDYSEVRVGAFGSPIQFTSRVKTREEKGALTLHLQQVLSVEQYEAYNQMLKQRKKAYKTHQNSKG